jgi:hypothetical protein
MSPGIFEVNNSMRSLFILSITLGVITGLTHLHSSAVHAADVILNEYNAVGSNSQLDEGAGADVFFGKSQGNGGNWFELLVINDNVDMRGWQLLWTEDEVVSGTTTAAGTITLSNDPIWSNLRSGSLITFIETANAGGVGNFNTGTDLSYDPLAGDWWINVATQQEASKGASAVATTTTNDGVPGDFSVGNSDWALTIQNASGGVVFGPVGEGASLPGGGVSNREGASLEGPVAPAGQSVTVAMWEAITPTSEFYDDTGSTSFGALNVDYDGATGTFTTIQDVSALRARVTPMLGDGDFNNDGMLSAADIDALTAAVRAGSSDLTFDVNQDGAVSGQDRVVWVEELKKTYFGDANLNGEFNSGDLVFVLTSGQYEDATPGNSTWATGDWNGDGDFTTSDFVTALQGGGYENGPRAAVSAVPEPSSALLLAIAALPLLRRRRG